MAAPNLRWIGYLSTIGVYGDQGGAWIDEATPPAPTNARTASASRSRRPGFSSAATAASPSDLPPVGHLRPGRNAITKLRNGTANRLSSRAGSSTASMSTISAC
jgi:hypothetical protein